MTKFKFELEIRFSPATGLGYQLKTILIELQKLIQNGVWYASDVDTTCDNLKIIHLNGPFLKKIGTYENMVALAESIQQFLCGVFILTAIDCGDEIKIECYTEDEPYRTVDNALLEIRTFDTTYFLLYSNELNTLNSLCKIFDGKINSENLS